MKKTLSIILAFSLIITTFAGLPAHAKAFSDVPATEWFAADVDFVTSLGLFNGTSDTAFSPAASMTRAMFVTVLGR